MDLPVYADLPAMEKTGERHAWGVCDEGDQLGSVSLQDAQPSALRAQTPLVDEARALPRC